MYNEATRYHVVAESQSADVIVYRTIPKRWPSIDQCHMFTGIPCIYTEMSRDVKTQILCVLISQGSLSRPMICLRCRSAYLRMFFTTIVVMVSEAFEPRVGFSKAIYIIAIDIMIENETNRALGHLCAHIG